MIAAFFIPNGFINRLKCFRYNNDMHSETKKLIGLFNMSRRYHFFSTTCLSGTMK